MDVSYTIKKYEPREVKMTEPTVLIMDGHSIKAVPVVRALKRHGLRVFVASAENTDALATYSRYCDEVVFHPPLEQEDAVVAFLLRYLNQHQVDVLFPLNDSTLLFFMKHRSSLEQFTAVAMPPNGALKVALDKGKTMQAAQQLNNGIEAPRTYEINNLDELPKLAVESFPVLVKPRTSWGAQGIRYVHNAEELMNAYPEVHALFPYPLIQEFIQYREGDKYQLLYLFDSAGILHSWYMHRLVLQASSIRSAADGSRIRGGVATLWSSCRDDDILIRGKELMEALGWQGFGFVECVRDQNDGKWKLMEINPRLSGTIALPLTHGVDFAYGAYLVALGKTPLTVLEYQVGVKAKHTLSSLVHFVRNPQRMKYLHEYLDPGYRDSIFTLLDPVPSMVLAGWYLNALIHRRPVS